MDLRLVLPHAMCDLRNAHHGDERGEETRERSCSHNGEVHIERGINGSDLWPMCKFFGVVDTSSAMTDSRDPLPQAFLLVAFKSRCYSDQVGPLLVWSIQGGVFQTPAHGDVESGPPIV
jgi:hypothetical protein